MTAFYINNGINAITFQSFVHFVEKLKKENILQADIYIDEEDEKNSNIEIVLALRNMMRAYMREDNFTFNIYAKRLHNAGIIILLTVPVENIYLSKYISVKYTLQMNTAHDAEHEQYTIKEIDDEAKYIDDKDFERIIGTLVANTNLEYDTVERYADKNLDFATVKKLGFGHHTFEPFLSLPEIGVFCDEIAFTRKIPYNFPSDLHKTLLEDIDKYNKGYVSRKELYHLLLDHLSSNIL